MKTRAVWADACHNNWHHTIDVKTSKNASTCLIESHIFRRRVVSELLRLTQAHVDALFRCVHRHAHDATSRAHEGTHPFHEERIKVEGRVEHLGVPTFVFDLQGDL